MDVCQNCGKTIRIQIFKGEDWCSELCRKALAKKIVHRKFDVTVNRIENVEPNLRDEIYYKTKQALKEHYGDR